MVRPSCAPADGAQVVTIRALTWLTTFGIPALLAWSLAPEMLVPLALLAAHAVVQGKGEGWP